ncbi:sugar phosphate isomerase/epimerase [Candidatus Bathyarchaeota archaeon]|nr:sugar phosphate isomerase/epimerase [Candidatus Bathyarchaeota archaeon]
MKLGLYSVTYSGTWYKGGLSVYGLVDRAVKYGFDGVEIDLKRPHGFPGDLDELECKKIRDYINSKDLEIAAVAGNNNFSSPIQESTENELLMLKEQLRVAKQMGAPFLRVFSAWRGVTFRDGIASYDIAKKYFNFMDSTQNEVYDRVKECLIEGTKWAEDTGVIMVLQNHPPVTDNYMKMLSIVKEVDSPFLQCCLDAPNCGPENQSDAYLTNAVHEVGNLQKHSHVGGEYSLDEKGEAYYVSYGDHIGEVNYPAFIKALIETGYEGYLSYEFCHVPRHHGKTLGIDYVDQNVENAVTYFRKLINQ